MFLSYVLLDVERTNLYLKKVGRYGSQLVILHYGKVTLAEPICDENILTPHLKTFVLTWYFCTLTITLYTLIRTKEQLPLLSVVIPETCLLESDRGEVSGHWSRGGVGTRPVEAGGSGTGPDTECPTSSRPPLQRGKTPSLLSSSAHPPPESPQAPRWGKGL